MYHFLSKTNLVMILNLENTVRTADIQSMERLQILHENGG